MNKAFDYLGRVTIPKEFRDRLGIEPEDKVRVTCYAGYIELMPVKKYCKLCGSKRKPIHNINDVLDINICDDCLKTVQKYDPTGK